MVTVFLSVGMFCYQETAANTSNKLGDEVRHKGPTANFNFTSRQSQFGRNENNNIDFLKDRSS